MALMKAFGLERAARWAWSQGWGRDELLLLEEVRHQGQGLLGDAG